MQMSLNSKNARGMDTTVFGTNMNIELYRLKSIGNDMIIYFSISNYAFDLKR